MTIRLSEELNKNVRAGYIAAKDVLAFLKERTDITFPDKPMNEIALKDLTYGGKKLIAAIFDKVEGTMIITFC